MTAARSKFIRPILTLARNRPSGSPWTDFRAPTRRYARRAGGAERECRLPVPRRDRPAQPDDPAVAEPDPERERQLRLPGRRYAPALPDPPAAWPDDAAAATEPDDAAVEPLMKASDRQAPPFTAARRSHPIIRMTTLPLRVIFSRRALCPLTAAYPQIASVPVGRQRRPRRRQ